MCSHAREDTMNLYRKAAFGLLALIWLFVLGVSAPEYGGGVAFCAALTVPYMLLYWLIGLVVRKIAPE